MDSRISPAPSFLLECPHTILVVIPTKGKHRHSSKPIHVFSHSDWIRWVSGVESHSAPENSIRLRFKVCDDERTGEIEIIRTNQDRHRDISYSRRHHPFPDDCLLRLVD